VNLPVYPKYKASGFEWLGKVPEHWKAIRLKYVASINDDALPEDTPADFEFDYVDIGGVSAVDGISKVTRIYFDNAPSRARRKVRDGDTIVSTVRTYLRAIAPIRKPPENLVVSTGFAVVRPRRAESGFLSYALRESSFVESIVARSVGVSYPAVNASEVGGICVPLPDQAEQKAIAAFLDRETARIDRLVARKRELIERLKEKRTALISRTVTRGLPPAAARAAGLPENPPLKPSGLAWLGDIPAHWDVLKITYGFALIGSGTTPKSDSDEFYDGDVAWVTTSELRETLILSTKERITRTALAAHPTLRVYPTGTLLFAMYGATIGRLGMLGIAATVNQACCAFAQPTRFVTRYVFYWLWMRRPILVSLSSGGGQPNLSQDDLRQVRLTLPPQHEQLAIADYLDAETAKLDALVAKVETAIERLQEYRTALITAAVTGKIDVRRKVPA